MEAEYVALSSFAQEVEFISMIIEEMTEVQKTSFIYEGNQGVIFLAKNRQVGIRTKHIDICHNFLRYMVEDKDVDIQYIISEDNPADIMTNNTLEVYFASHMNKITEGKLWELVDTGRENFNNTRVVDDVISHDKTEYSNNALAEVMDGIHKNYWILVTRYIIAN